MTASRSCSMNGSRSGNPTLRSFLKLSSSVNGVIVTGPDSTDPDYPLKKWDVITKIGSTPLDIQGMVNLDNNLRVSFKYLVQKTARNGKLPLTVVRDGKEMPVELPVANDRPRLILDLNGSYPPYFVYGLLVFSTATTEFIHGLMTGNFGGGRMTLLGVSGSPLMTRLGDKPAFEGESLVVVSSPLFPHKLSKGFANPSLRGRQNHERHPRQKSGPSGGSPPRCQGAAHHD